MYRQKCNDIEQFGNRNCASTICSARSVEGFGLIELLVTLSLVAIISTLAVPSLKHMINQGRLRSATNNFAAALYGARSHAIRTGKPAMLCPSANGATCDNSEFDKGWIITTAPQDPTAALRTWPAPKVAVSRKPGNSRFFTHGRVLTYLGDGRAHKTPDGHSLGSAMFCITNQRRTVSVSYSGRINVKSGSC